MSRGIFTDNKSFASVIRRARVDAGLTQEQLARALGWNPDSIERIESAEIEIPYSHWPEVIEALPKLKLEDLAESATSLKRLTIEIDFDAISLGKKKLVRQLAIQLLVALAKSRAK